jgi:energy-coupling factor transport system permease protein
MRLLVPLVPERGAVLARANPVAKLVAATALMLAALLAIDLVTAALLLAGELAAVPLSGLRASALARRAWPLVAVAVGIGLANGFFPAQPGASPLLEVGPLRPSADSLVVGLALGLRLMAISFAGLLALATTDPTDLADALAQQLGLSPRFAIGTLAVVRLAPLVGVEWQTLGLARRARGVDAGRNPIAAARLFGGRLLALLVSAIRRGTRLATAMEARGFGTTPSRTWARPQRMRVGDWLLIGAAALLALGASWLSVALGSWRFLLG